MTPATTVSHVAHDARLNGERLVAPVVVSDYPQHRPDNEVPVMPHANPRMPMADDALLDEQTIKAVKAQNTNQLLKSNYWFEMANISRWCTTGLIGATMVTLFNTAMSIAAATTQGAAAIAAGGVAAAETGMTIGMFSALPAGVIMGSIGAALLNPLVLGIGAALAVAATVTVKASQHSRKVFVEKSFDVQDTLMQRQAKLVGKSVEEAVAPQQPERPKQSWAQRTQASLDQAESQQASR